MKLGKKAKEILATVAPTVGTALGGPLGGVAGTFLARALGVSSDKDIEEALLSGSPEALAEARQAEAELAKFMRDMDVKEEQLRLADVKSARELGISRGIVPQIMLSVLFIAGYFLILWGLLRGYVTLPDSMRTEFSILLGVLTAAVPQILQFWFGSSKGSKDKDKAMLHGYGQAHE